MPFQYISSLKNSALRQGEILADIWEHRLDNPPIQIDEGRDINHRSIFHPRLMIMTPDCDLLWDYQERFQSGVGQEQSQSELDHPRLVPQVFLCELYVEEEIRSRVGGSDIWRRIRNNQDERYHHLQSAPVDGAQGITQPGFYLDFKKILTLPTLGLYEALDKSQVSRLGIMPPVFLHDLMHRFYSFMGRVGVPEE